jgi:hypothetical protein
MTRRRTHREPSKESLKAYRQHGEKLLAQAGAIWSESDLLDTAVRDDISTGLAHLVHAAYDSIANSMNIPDATAWMSFIDNATAEWFRERGFAEWFCLAAACSFNTSRPRTLVERTLHVVNPKPRRKTKRKAA